MKDDCLHPCFPKYRQAWCALCGQEDISCPMHGPMWWGFDFGSRAFHLCPSCTPWAGGKMPPFAFLRDLHLALQLFFEPEQDVWGKPVNDTWRFNRRTLRILKGYLERALDLVNAALEDPGNARAPKTTTS